MCSSRLGFDGGGNGSHCEKSAGCGLEGRDPCHGPGDWDAKSGRLEAYVLGSVILYLVLLEYY
jgi:hypothetical protein